MERLVLWWATSTRGRPARRSTDSKQPGTLDTSTELGKRVYELVKAGSLAWSIGYTVPKGGKRKAAKGVTELTEVDLLEISAVATPANEGTRT
jgi:HK97 family phage prohead protease